MYYSVINERDVCISDDPIHGFRIWGEIPEIGEKTAVDLCEVFLEYAMTCTAMQDHHHTLVSMEIFSKHLGECLAKYIKACTPLETQQNMGVCAVECVLESMHAHFKVEQRETESRYLVLRCPLGEASQRTGLPYKDLAHYGINKMCQSLVHALQPSVDVYSPEDSEAEHIFAVRKSVYA